MEAVLMLFFVGRKVTTSFCKYDIGDLKQILKPW